MVQGKINKGRHTDHPAGRHSIRTNQCLPPPSPPIFFTGRMPFLPSNQQHQSTEGSCHVADIRQFLWMRLCLKWRWALVSLDAVAPSWMVGVSASDSLPLHHKVQKFSSGIGSPGWSRKKGCKMVVVVVWCLCLKLNKHDTILLMLQNQRECSNGKHLNNLRQFSCTKVNHLAKFPDGL